MPKITDIYVVIMADAGPDDEGIIAIDTGGMMMPLVFSSNVSEKGREIVKNVARGIAMAKGKPATLVRFTHREDIETIEPKPPDDV